MDKNLKYINLFEKFTEETLSKNNYEYNTFFKNAKSRSDKVAWSEPRSQIKNFNLVSKFINDGDSVLDYGCGIGDFVRYLDRNKNISNYLGVDINSNFINMAKKDYPDNNFQLIKDVNEIRGKWDSVCAIGVFTWFITKDDFIKTINKLYDICNKQVLITCLHNYSVSDNESYWKSNYRRYSYELFKELFPKFNIDFKLGPKLKHHDAPDTILIRITK
jgi:cyclopropane fatty-acyl-phospholipid synthase-like methyltransferase